MKADTPSSALKSLCDRYWDHVCFEQPLTAILAGRPTRDDVLMRTALADLARQHEADRGFLAELAAIPFSALRGVDRQTHQLLEHDLKLAVRTYAVKGHLWPMIYPLGPEATVNYLGDLTILTGPVDAGQYLRRLRSIPAALAGIVECLAAGQREGFSYPKLVLERAATVVRALAARPLDQASLMRPFVTSRLQSAEMLALRKAAEEVVANEINVAFASYADFLVGPLASNARDSVACIDMPLGREHYAMLIETYTTERGDPEEIHAFGLSEVARISAEMLQIAAEAGHPGDLEGYRKALLARPGQILPSGEALRERIEILSKRIDARLPEFFGRLPRMSYGVRSIPEATAALLPPAYAQPNPANGTAAGIHWITSLPERCPSYMHIPLAMHEAWPGHLMHLALMQEMELPDFRRHNSSRYSAQLEGWALYSEWLGYDFGLYDSPDKIYGRLEMEIWRACRLVVDTGLHWKGWSRDQAIEFMTRHMSMPIETIRAEVDRYIGMPAQALAYLIGFRCVKEVRAEAEAQLGDAFRVRDFHDAFMAVGAVTLPVLRESIREWAQDRRAAAA